MDNCKIDVLSLPEGISDRKYFNVTLNSISFASDNSNQNIAFVACTFNEEISIYGKVTFVACDFKNGYVEESGSTATIIP